MLENTVEKKLVNGVKKLGGLVRKAQWIGRRGAPDRLILYCGKVFFVELKSPTGKLSPHQLKEQELFLAQGIPIYTLKNTEEVKEFLDKLEKYGLWATHLN